MLATEPADNAPIANATANAAVLPDLATQLRSMLASVYWRSDGRAELDHIQPLERDHSKAAGSRVMPRMPDQKR
jgi:hypothetical protein